MTIWNPGYTEFTYFWKEGEEHGEFSQWWQGHKFTIAGVKYNTAEQFMMASKAREFGCPDVEALIMKSTSPKEQKALGRNVYNFNEARWDAVCKDFVREGNVAKFSQNKDLFDKLIATKGTLLVEASPYDKIWGIGIDPTAAKRGVGWQGTNWLGEVLTQIRLLSVLD